MEEAVRSKVKRVIFASSNHTQHGTSIDDFEKPESLRKDPPKHTLRDTPIPDTLYGVSKVFGESLGAYYAARFGIEFVALRIGWAAQEHLPTRSERNEYLKSLIGTPAEAYMRSILLSREDCASVFTRSLLVPLHEKVPFMVAYAMSDNTDNIFDMSETREKLGYIPQTNAEDRFKKL
jgi:L-arabinose 1-dehydrogenase [NAD(P)+]